MRVPVLKQRLERLEQNAINTTLRLESLEGEIFEPFREKLSSLEGRLDHLEDQIDMLLDSLKDLNKS